MIEVTSKEQAYRNEHVDDIESKAEDIKRPCTICRQGLFVADARLHPVLGVTICAKCVDFYKSGEFSCDEDGDQKYCTWCGQGGIMLFCSSCKNGAFCKVCIKKNLPEKELEKTRDDNWLCYLCNCKPLWKLRAICDATIAKAKLKQRKALGPNMRLMSQLEKGLNGTNASSETEDSSDNQRLNRSSRNPPEKFIVRDDVDPHAEPSSDEYVSFDEDESPRPRSSKKKTPRKQRRREKARSETEDDSEYENRKPASKPRRRLRVAHSESEGESDEVPATNRTKKDEHRDTRSGRSSSSARKKSFKAADANSKKAKSSDSESEESQKPAHRKDRREKSTKPRKHSEGVKKNRSDSEHNSRDKPVNRDSKKKQPTSTKKQEPKPSTSLAVDTFCSDDDFHSSSGDELNLDWLYSTINDFQIFVTKNSDFLEGLKEKSGALNNKSSLEEVRAVSKVTHKHFSKCIKALDAYKENFQNDYSSWCDQYVNLHKLDDSNSGKNGAEKIVVKQKKEKSKEAAGDSMEEEEPGEPVEPSSDAEDNDLEPMDQEEEIEEEEKQDQSKDEVSANSVPEDEKDSDSDQLFDSARKVIDETLEDEQLASDREETSEAPGVPPASRKTNEKSKSYPSSNDSTDDLFSEFMSTARPEAQKEKTPLQVKKKLDFLEMKKAGVEKLPVTISPPKSNKKENSTYRKPGPASKTMRQSGSSPPEKNRRKSSSPDDAEAVAKKEEEMCRKALLEDSSNESDGQEKTIKRRKKFRRIKVFEDPQEIIEDAFVPDNWEEFEDDVKLRSISFVPCIEHFQADKFIRRRKSRRRDSDADIENLCDLAALENPTETKSSAVKKVKKPKKKKSLNKSDDDGSSSESDKGEEIDGSDMEFKAGGKSDDLKPDEEEEARDAILMSSDSDKEGTNSESEAKKGTKKKTQKSSKDRNAGSRNKEESKWRKAKELRMKITSDSSSDEAPKQRKKKAVLDSDESYDENKDGSDVVALSSSDDFQPANKKSTKRKRKSSSSEQSSGDKSSSDDDDLFSNKKKKKRKRIVSKPDSSDSDCKTVAKKVSPLKGRTKKILRNSELEAATQRAAKDEKERQQRHTELQQLYNKIIEERGQDATVSELVLEFDIKTKDPYVEVHKEIATKLKPHQVTGIKFMWTTVFESVAQSKKSAGTGCILAHCMGLGKSLQIVSLVHTVLVHPDMEVKTVLVVTPLTTVENWKNEFAMWTKNINYGNDIDVYNLSTMKKNTDRRDMLRTWHTQGGVMIVSYDLYRNLANLNPKKKLAKSIGEMFQKSLVDPGPDIIICDEGHVLKNEDKKLSIVMSHIKTLRRIVLTGTPLQNNLIEYHCMMQFVKPNLLGNRKEFINRFVAPIKAGQHKESTPMQVRVMKKRACVLHKMLLPSVQRYDYNILKPHLQEKFEYVVKVRLSELQVKLYSHYLENCARRMTTSKGACLFADYQNLLRVWNHPYGLLLRAQQDEGNESEADSAGSLANFIDDDEESDSASGSGSEDSDSRDSSKPKRTTRQDVANGDQLVEGGGSSFINSWWRKEVKNEELSLLTAGNKMTLLFTILKECDKIGDKLLVFSQSLYSLELIEFFLREACNASDEEREEYFCGIPGEWYPGKNYFRIDGKTNVINRANWIKKFNRKDNLDAKLFLVSTRAGGLGVNMVGANRVVLFDASWNPSIDMQAIFRVYRFGQEKPCYIYRFLAAGTMEEKIYDRQVNKLALSGRVVDKHTIENHYTQADLEELYSFEPYRENDKIPAFPKDRLLAELYQTRKATIEEYFEHDSLLADKPEENLTEEEQQAAWHEFEQEKDMESQRKEAAQERINQGLIYQQKLQEMRLNNTSTNQELVAALMGETPFNQYYKNQSPHEIALAQAQLRAMVANSMGLKGIGMQNSMQSMVQNYQPDYQMHMERASKEHTAMNQLSMHNSNLLSHLNRALPSFSGGASSSNSSPRPSQAPSARSIPEIVPIDDDDEVTYVQPSTSAASGEGNTKLKVRTDLYKP